MAPKPHDPRELAARVLVRVERDRAFAAAVLDAELGRVPQIDARDRALATELTYGTLRVFGWLEERVAVYAPRGLGRLPPPVRAHLFVCAYQLFFTRVPPFAAVDEAVNSVSAHARHLSGFTNAVLRKVAREASAPHPSLEEATVAAASPWLRAALARTLGEEGAVRFLSASSGAPPVGLRVERAEERDRWLDALRLHAPTASFEPGKISPHAIIARGAGKLTELPGWAEAAISVQEEGSQAIALALGVRPGECVLDACAGRGNKTTLLARAVGPTGSVDAADLHPQKLDRLEQELGRLGLRVGHVFAVDWSQGSGAVPEGYDRALVDAPCSGIGTLRRRPELALRRAAGDFGALAELQARILRRVATRVRSGGTILYAVCSVLREEAEDVIERVTSEEDGLERVEGSARRLLPDVEGTDGYFFARLTKR